MQHINEKLNFKLIRSTILKANWEKQHRRTMKEATKQAVLEEVNNDDNTKRLENKGTPMKEKSNENKLVHQEIATNEDAGFIFGSEKWCAAKSLCLDKSHEASDDIRCFNALRSKSTEK